jgi:hypothetical protein
VAEDVLTQAHFLEFHPEEKILLSHHKIVLQALTPDRETENPGCYVWMATSNIADRQNVDKR